MTTDDTRTRVGFALGAAAVLGSLNLAVNFASQAVSSGARREVEAMYRRLGQREASRAGAAFVHENHMRALRSLLLATVVLCVFALATRPALVALGRDVVRWWTLPAALVGGVLASVPIWWLADTAGYDLTWGQEILALAVCLAAVAVVRVRILR